MEYHQIDPPTEGVLAPLDADLRTLLSATVIDICAASTLAYCAVSSLDDAQAVLVAAHGSGSAALLPGASWHVSDIPPARQAVVTGRPVFLDPHDDPRLARPQQRILIGHDDLRSLAFVPLQSIHALTGLLVVGDRRSRDLGVVVADLAPVARLLGQVLDNDRRLASLSRSADDLALVLDADIEAQSRSAGPEQVLRVIARRLAELCRAPMVDIYAIDEDALRPLAAWHFGRYVDAPGPETLPLSERPFALAAVLSGAPETHTSAEEPETSPVDRGHLTERRAQSVLSIPLLVHGRAIGVAEVLDTRPRRFDDVTRAAGALADIAAHLLDKALLLEALEQRNASLRELVRLGARANTAARPEETASFVAQRLLEVLGATVCAVHRIDGGRFRRLLTLDRRSAHDDPAQSVVATPTLDPHTFRPQDLVVLTGPNDPRLTDQTRQAWQRGGFASQLSIPLFVDARLTGLIDVFDVRPRQFAQHVDFAKSVGQLVAAAFDNATLLERLAESNRHLGELVESSLEFGASLDLAEVLRSVASRMCVSATAARCDIYALETDRLVALTSTDARSLEEGFAGTEHPLGESAIARHAIDIGQPVVVSDVTSDPRLTDAERVGSLSLATKNLIELPLVHGGEVIGLAIVFDLLRADVPQTDLLRGLAQIAAQAIANAKVHAALDDGAARLRRINEAGLELASSLDGAEVAAVAARRLCEVAAARDCVVYTLHGGRLRRDVDLRQAEPGRHEPGQWLDLGNWRAARLAVESRSVVRLPPHPGHNSDPASAATIDRTGGALIVPLLADHRVIGVVELSATPHSDFSDDDVATIEAVCRTAALAMANAELFRDAQLQARESELLNRIAARAGSTLESGAIAAAAVDELAKLVPFKDACLLMRTDPGRWKVDSCSSDDFAALVARHQSRLEEGAAILRRELVSVVDLQPAPPQELERPDDAPGSLLAIAIVIDEELAGALVLWAPSPGAFADVNRRLLERVGALLSLSIRNAGLYETIKTMHVANLKALISALNARDSYAVGHAARVAAYMLLLGRELGWPADQLEEISEAAFLHDVGRIGISDDVLYKPGRLNAEETAELRRHPNASAEIIQPLFTSEIVLAVRHHHERWDGAGYPDGLTGADIPEMARALCIVDSYDAMSFQRQHHEALSYADCLAELDRCRGTQFDPDMVTVFMRVLDTLDERRSYARATAEEAAARIDPGLLTELQASRDETSPQALRLAGLLREIRDTRHGVRSLTALVPGHDEWRMACDPEEDPSLHRCPGDPVSRVALGDRKALLESDRNVLQLDDFGVWVSGVAEIRDDVGTTVGMTRANLPPADDWPADLVTSAADHDRTFSAILDSATARLGRARVDAVTDGLTGLYNQRYFKQRLTEEVERAAEQGRPLSLLFCDLDHFKGYNDRLGHTAGDKALRAVSGVLLHSIRQVDLAARYGGEELTIILLDSPREAAGEVAERIRQGVAALDLGEERGITVSVGTATFPTDATMVEELLDKADWAMYVAKRMGRDRVVAFSTLGATDSPGQSALRERRE